MREEEPFQNLLEPFGTPISTPSLSLIKSISNNTLPSPPLHPSLITLYILPFPHRISPQIIFPQMNTGFLGAFLPFTSKPSATSSRTPRVSAPADFKVDLKHLRERMGKFQKVDIKLQRLHDTNDLNRKLLNTLQMGEKKEQKLQKEIVRLTQKLADSEKGNQLLASTNEWLMRKYEGCVQKLVKHKVIDEVEAREDYRVDSKGLHPHELVDELRTEKVRLAKKVGEMEKEMERMRGRLEELGERVGSGEGEGEDMGLSDFDDTLVLRRMFTVGQQPDKENSLNLPSQKLLKTHSITTRTRESKKPQLLSDRTSNENISIPS